MQKKARELDLIIKIKELTKLIHNEILKFPKCERVLKDDLERSLHSLLYCTYYANTLPRDKYYRDRIESQYKIGVNIKMINFYIEEAYDKKYISEKVFKMIGKQLIHIDSILRGWMRSEELKEVDINKPVITYRRKEEVNNSQLSLNLEVG